MNVYKNHQGSISIFLMIIFLSLLMLAGLIVDIARVMVAERKVQNALDTAVRSVLAGYDEELVGQFGIYGFRYSTEKEKELKQYFLVNLVDRHKNFNFINYNIDNVKIKGSAYGSILNKEIYKEQILEYMKYKGPVLITENVINTFLKGTFDKKADLYNSGKKIKDSTVGIEGKKEAFNKKIKKLQRHYIGRAVDELVTMENIEKGIVEFKEALDEIEIKLQQNNEKIAKIKEETNYLLEENGKDGLENIAGFDNKEIIKLKNKLEKLNNDIKYNKRILQQIKSLEKEYKRINSLINTSIYTNTGDLSDLLAKKESLRAQINDLYDTLRHLEELPLATHSELPSLDEKNKKEKESWFTKLKGLYVKEITEDNPITLCIEEKYFIEANEQSNIEKNEVLDSSGVGSVNEVEDISEEKFENIGLNVFSYIKKMTNTLKQIAQDGGEKVYITEYVMDKYTFVTSPTKRGHYFNKGEVEYIICGNKNEINNITETFSLVWGLRFVVNTVDRFFTNKAPTFLSRLGLALIEGFEDATKDMSAMYKGEGAPICDSLSRLEARLSYSDHLRLLLLMKNENTLLDRMRQLIQIDIRQSKQDFELKNYSSYITAEAEVSVDLWFSSLLQLDKLGFDHIKGNKYMINKTATAEY